MRAMLAATIAIVCALGAPRAGWACPACAGRSDGGIGALFIYAAMIVLPFLIAVVAVRVIRRLEDGGRRVAAIQQKRARWERPR